mmetsp:Transcript_13710/g.20701  ORF Transcript_13710/g.20701 Transcript_13710/m.20701 type:complete len:202 (-) Transcript_13710:331-936(-)
MAFPSSLTHWTSPSFFPCFESKELFGGSVLTSIPCCSDVSVSLDLSSAFFDASSSSISTGAETSPFDPSGTEASGSSSSIFCGFFANSASSASRLAFSSASLLTLSSASLASLAFLSSASFASLIFLSAASLALLASRSFFRLSATSSSLFFSISHASASICFCVIPLVSTPPIVAGCEATGAAVVPPSFCSIAARMLDIF